MNPKTKAETAFDTGLQVEAFMDLANLIGQAGFTDRIPEAFDDHDLLGDLLTQGAHRHHESVAPLANVVNFYSQNSDLGDDEDLFETLMEILRINPEVVGIYIQASAPTKKRLEGDTVQVRMGIRRLQWFFGTTYEEAYAHAEQWAKEGVFVDD